MELSELRKEIDSVNDQILELFLRRMALSEEVAACKRAQGLPVLNAQREQEILDAISAGAGDLAPYARRLFTTLFELSREHQADLLSRKEAD